MQTPPIAARRLTRVALAALVALMLVSVALVVVGASAPTDVVARGLPPGTMLALVKIVALAYVGKRVWNHHVYALQWSSMFILLFVAEGTVRATSDPQPLAAIGCVEAIAATVFFGAVLAILRPLKQRARATPPSR